MSKLLYCIVLLPIICLSKLFNVGLNVNSSFETSIATIEHDVATRVVIIRLQGIRRCEMPSFLIRLSGNAVYVLELVKHEHESKIKHLSGDFFASRKSKYHFSYPPIIDAGTYSLEVLVTLCSGLLPSSRDRVCVEDCVGGRNIANAPYTVYLEATHQSQQESMISHKIKQPRWALRTRNESVKDSGGIISSLHTRYQLNQCGMGGTPGDLHQQYEWVDGPDWRNVATKLRGNETTVCLVGGVHAQELVAYAKSLSTTAAGVSFVHIGANSPAEFSIESLVTNACEYAAIGFNQLSSRIGPADACSESCFTAEMRAVTSQLSTPSYTGATTVLLRSFDYRPMSTQILSCPPKDTMSPPVVDMANRVLRRLSQESRMGFIDLMPVTAPLWDASPDFLHTHAAVLGAELGWILHYALELVGAGEGPRVVGWSGKKDKDVVIQFSDRPGCYYLVRGGVAREFPNTDTLQRMGYSLRSARTLSPAQRRGVQFGSALPEL